NYLNIDNESLFKNSKEVKINELSIYEYNNDINIAIRLIDKNLKERGILISSSTREEITKHKEVVVSHKIAIAITEDKLYIAPVTIEKMDKKFKEKCRIHKIPKNIRAYIFKLEEEQLFIF
ncbi:MAG: tRNA(Ile)-lysidine synthase, partial [Arcobacteraceae bacterium]